MEGKYCLGLILFVSLAVVAKAAPATEEMPMNDKAFMDGLMKEFEAMRVNSGKIDTDTSMGNYEKFMPLLQQKYMDYYTKQQLQALDSGKTDSKSSGSSSGSSSGEFPSTGFYRHFLPKLQQMFMDKYT